MCKLLEDYVLEIQILFFGMPRNYLSDIDHKQTHTKVGRDSNHDKVPRVGHSWKFIKPCEKECRVFFIHLRENLYNSLI